MTARKNARTLAEWTEVAPKAAYTPYPMTTEEVLHALHLFHLGAAAQTVRDMAAYITELEARAVHAECELVRERAAASLARWAASEWDRD